MTKSVSITPLPAQDVLRALVKRVVADSGMHRMAACTFVAGMFPGNVGWDVLRAIEAKPDRAEVALAP